MTLIYSYRVPILDRDTVPILDTVKVTKIFYTEALAPVSPSNSLEPKKAIRPYLFSSKYYLKSKTYKLFSLFCVASIATHSLVNHTSFIGERPQRQGKVTVLKRYYYIAY